MVKRNLLLGSCLFLFGVAGASAATIGAAAVSPTSAPAGVATPATFTVVITDPSVIGSSVNLQQVNSLGQAAVIGTMYDDGTHGDATAGDHIYTLQSSIFQQNPGTLTYRVRLP